ncbi:unnamed protein product [Cunninghamella blakesleeana]
MAIEPVSVYEYVDDLEIGNDSHSTMLLEVKKTIQKYKDYKEEEWSEERIKELKEFTDKIKDFHYLGYYFDLPPGSCYRQFCSLFNPKGSWKLYEDVQILSFLKEGISEPKTIAEILTTRSIGGIKYRIDRLMDFNLHSIDLYFGRHQIPCEEIIDLTTKVETLNLTSSKTDASSIEIPNIETSTIESPKNKTDKVNNKLSEQKEDDTNDVDNSNEPVKNKEKVDEQINQEKENSSVNKKLTKSKKKGDISIDQEEKNNIPSKKETKLAKKCSYSYYMNHVYRMKERDAQIYEVYYKNDKDRNNDLIKDSVENKLTIRNIGMQVLNALQNCDGHCPYCKRELKFLEYKNLYTGKIPLAASFDHKLPGMVTCNGDTKLQVTCQQCNYAKSNATDKEFREYLQSIKDFHNKKKEESKIDPIIHKNQVIEAYKELTRERRYYKVNTKAVKKRNTEKGEAINDIIDQFENMHLVERCERKSIFIDTKETKKSTVIDDNDDREIPKSLRSDEEQFFDLIRKIGYRDPTTGALGVWDSTWQISTRFTLIEWKDNPYKIVTGVQIPSVGICGKEIVLKFTKDARNEYKAEDFYTWLDTIKNHDGDFI